MMKKLFFFGMMGAMALTFAACSSEDEVAVNPTFDGENVKSAITLSINSNAKATRMDATNTQNSTSRTDVSFLGMDHIFLYPTTAATIEGTTALKTGIQLDAIAASEISAAQSSKIYTNQSIPVGTKGFLFYGKTNKTTATADADMKAKGATKDNLATTSATPGAINFQAVPVVETFPSMTAVETALNNIAAALKTYTATATFNASLAQAYADFTVTPVRAGSKNALTKTLDILQDIVDNSGAAAADITSLTNLITTAKTAAAAAEVAGLPEGAFQLQWKGDTDKFKYLAEPTVGASNVVNVYDIVYPAELYYLTSTPLKAKDSEWTWPVTVDTWSAETWAGATDVVNASTRYIALVNNINYGVAMLETQVKIADGLTTLTDNAKAVLNNGSENQEITIPTAGYPLTGVLVGGQPAQVEWNFLPATSGASFTKTLYDNVTNSVKATTGTFADNGSVFTLLYDTNGETNGKVNVALEFENTGDAFYGVNGVILNGMKFYLVGQLDLSAGTGTVEWLNGDFFYPSKTDRVFIQDHKTVAKFTFAKTALQNAYVTVPDLRATQMQLGLSVDLYWEAAKTYNVTFE